MLVSFSFACHYLAVVKTFIDSCVVPSILIICTVFVRFIVAYLIYTTGSSSSSSSSGGLLKEGQAVSAEVPGLASVLAKLLCTLLPVLQVRMNVVPNLCCSSPPGITRQCPRALFLGSAARVAATKATRNTAAAAMAMRMTLSATSTTRESCQSNKDDILLTRKRKTSVTYCRRCSRHGKWLGD